jgi:hypothetical protein
MDFHFQRTQRREREETIFATNQQRTSKTEGQK